MYRLSSENVVCVSNFNAKTYGFQALSAAVPLCTAVDLEKSSIVKSFTHLTDGLCRREELSYAFEKPGVYYVTIAASNDFISVDRGPRMLYNQSTLHNSVPALGEIKLNIPSAFDVSKGVLPIGLSSESKTLMGIFVTVAANDVDLLTVFVDKDTDEPTFNLPVASEGSVNFTVSVTNRLETVVMSALTVAQKPVENLTLSASAESGQENLFYLGETVTFEALAGGSPVSYSFNFGDGTEAPSNASLDGFVSHVFSVAGTYTVKITASNLLNSVEHSLKITVAPVDFLRGVKCEPVYLAINQTLTCTVEFTNIIDDICIQAHVPFQPNQYVHGRAEACGSEKDLPEGFELSPRIPDLTFEQEYTFDAVANVTGTFVFTSPVKTISVDFNVSVVEEMCSSPLLEISRGASADDPIEMSLSKTLTLSTADVTVTTQCDATDEVASGWTVTGISEEVSDFSLRVGKNLIELESNTLKGGLYEAVFTIGMIGYPLATSSVSIFIHYSASALTAEFEGGVLRQFGLSDPAEFELTVSDPDEPGAAADSFGYHWFCRQSTEPEAEYTDGPFSPLGEKVVAVGSEDKSGGGCFGAGPGWIEWTVFQSSLSFDALNAVSDVTLEMTFVITRGDRFTLAKQEFEILAQTPIQVTVTCLECPAKLNPAKDYELQATSENFPDVSLATYSWMIEAAVTPEDKNSDFAEIELIPEYMEQTVQVLKSTVASLTLKSGLLAEGGRYRISVTVAYPDMQEGTNYAMVTVNWPPYGGECAATPTEGVSTETLFKITCSGWKDEGDAFIRRPATDTGKALSISYQYQLGDEETLYPVMLPAASQFPYVEGGSVKIIVTVCDEYNTKRFASFYVKVTENKKSAAELHEVLLNVNIKDNPEAALASFILASKLSAAPADSESTDGAAQSDDAEALQAATDKQNKEIMDKFGDLSAAELSPSTMLGAIQAISGASSSMGSSADPDLMASAASLAAAMASKLENMDDLPTEQKDAAIGSVLGTLSTATDMGSNKLDSDAKAEADKQAALEAAAANADEAEDDGIDEDAAAKAAAEKKAQDEAREKQAGAAGSCVAGMAAAGRAVAKALPLGGKKYLGSTKLGVSVSKTLGADAGDIESPQGACAADLGSALSNRGGKNATIATTNSGSANNLYGYMPAPVTSGLMIMYLKDENNNDFDVEGVGLDVDLDSSPDDSGGAEMNTTDMMVDPESGIVYTQLNIASDGAGIRLDMSPDIEGTIMEIYVNFNVNLSNTTDRPTREAFDFYASLPKDTAPQWELFMGANVVEVGVALIGIINTPPGENVTANNEKQRRRREAGLEAIDSGSSGKSALNETAAKAFKMKALVSTCRYFDTVKQDWTSAGCSVAEGSTANKTKCKCSKITNNVRTFGGGSMIPSVNPINFANIFANFGDLLSDNAAVFATVVALLIGYVLVLVWARRMDKKDVARWGVMPLEDNHPLEKYHYQLTVETGMRAKAQTESKISFALSGAEGETGVRRLDDGGSLRFGRGSIRYFMMTTSKGLGDLNFLRIWHDNKGEGVNASWYLTRIIVEDLFTGRKSYFLVDDWLAVDEGDGQLDRVIPVAGDEQLKSFNHLFFATSKKNLSDTHLWISVLVRPTKSEFTRVQRWTCCVSLLCVTMISNAMFYQPVEGADVQQAIHLGPVTLTVEILYVAAVSTAMIVPSEMLLTSLFTKSKPKHFVLSPEEIADRDRDMSEMSFVQRIKFRILRFSRQRYIFPHWFLIFAWFFAFITIMVPCFFVVMYSLEWGKERAEGWLSALFVSVVQTIILVQPVKIILMAAVFSLFLKKLEEDDDALKNNANNASADDDEELDEVYAGLFAPNRESAPPPPPAGIELERQRAAHQKENHMYSIVWEMTLYWAYLLLISFIAWGGVDGGVFNSNSVFKAHYQGGSGVIQIDQVTDGFKFYQWVADVLATNSYYDVDYRDTKVGKADRRYASNMVGYRVTNPRLRQLRVPPDECTDDLSTEARKMVGAWGCQASYSIFSHEERNFGVNWQFDPPEKDKYVRIERSFRWSSAFDLKGIPTTGVFATYSGGGYVADLGKTNAAAQKMVAMLKAYNWIDTHTRAIFAEFTVYNPSANLFTFCMYLFEFPTVGSITITQTVKTFRMYELSAFAAIIMAAQLIFVVHLIHYTVKEVKEWRKIGRKAYLEDPWNWLDIFVVFLSYLAVVMTILKKLVLAIAADDLAGGESTLNFDSLMTYADQHTNVIGMLVFLATIKFLKLLRFNRMMCMLIATVRVSSFDLFMMFIVFFVCFIAYAFFCYGVFISHVESLNSFTRVAQNQLMMMLGKFDFSEMMAAQPLLGPLYFFTYQLFVFFVLMNMFITIISMGFSHVREHPEVVDFGDVDFPDFLASKMKKMVKPGQRQKRLGTGFVTMDDALEQKLRSLDKQVNDTVRDEVMLTHRNSKRAQLYSVADDSVMADEFVIVDGAADSKTGRRPSSIQLDIDGKSSSQATLERVHRRSFYTSDD